MTEIKNFFVSLQPFGNGFLEGLQLMKIYEREEVFGVPEVLSG